jgi:NAD(P)H-dependent flavin oxidoreductase YrpB (nitropropane dioxygenase family)
MLQTAFTRRLGIDHPIVQAGMGAEAGAELASAVSEAGGLGTLGTIGTPPPIVAASIARTRDLTSRPFALNVVTFEGAPMRDEILDVGIAERATIVTLSFGDSVPAVRRFKAAGAFVIVQAQDVEQAEAALAAGADALIAQGTEAGGHTGRRGTLSFAAQVLELAGQTPVLVAGGVGNGKGLAAALAMGAAGVVMGTRFKASEEFAGNPAHKAAIIASNGGNTISDLSNDGAYPFRWPENVRGRVVATPISEEWAGRVDDLRAKAESYGSPRGIFSDPSLEPPVDLNWAGESAGLVDELLPAAEIVRRTVAEAERLLRRVAAVLG